MSSKSILHTIDQNYIDKYNLDYSYLNKKIVIYSDRYLHMNKHKYEFSNTKNYFDAINNIQDIVSNPDFIVIDQKRKGMEFIKKINNDVLVAARLSNSNELKIKSLYPINATKKDKLYNIRTK